MEPRNTLESHTCGNLSWSNYAQRAFEEKKLCIHIARKGEHKYPHTRWVSPSDPHTPTHVRIRTHGRTHALVVVARSHYRKPCILLSRALQNHACMHPASCCVTHKESIGKSTLPSSSTLVTTARIVCTFLGPLNKSILCFSDPLLLDLALGICTLIRLFKPESSHTRRGCSSPRWQAVRQGSPSL